MANWEQSQNIAKLPQGSFRSVAGYAGESLVVGRALLCGFNLFFKAWRDSKYDAVLDAEGILYRIEIKQTLGNTTISVSSGGRSGQQISRDVESREKPISTEDCDYLIATQSNTGLCWIVPAELIEVLQIKSLNIKAIKVFEEKWGIFTLNDSVITPHLKSGFRKIEDEDSLNAIVTRLSINIATLANTDFSLNPANKMLKRFKLNQKDRLVAEIWMKIFSEMT